MYNRVRRAARRLAGEHMITAAGVVHSYDPMVLGSALAAGMGAAAVGGGAAIARDGSGRRVSATARAVDRVTSWAARDSQRHARLPHSLLAVITNSQVMLSRWSAVASAGPPIIWPAGSFTATLARHRTGGVEVRVVLNGGKLAVLAARSGPNHRSSRRALHAITELGQTGK